MNSPPTQSGSSSIHKARTAPKACARLLAQGIGRTLGARADQRSTASRAFFLPVKLAFPRPVPAVPTAKRQPTARRWLASLFGQVVYPTFFHQQRLIPAGVQPRSITSETRINFGTFRVGGDR